MNKTSVTILLATFLLCSTDTVSALTLPKYFRVWRLFSRNDPNPKLPEFVVTSINVTHDGDNGRVLFHGRMSGKAEHEKASVLTDIKKTKDKVRGHPVYSAREIKRDHFQATVNERCPVKLTRNANAETLLCVHGFNTQPHEFFASLDKSKVYERPGYPTIIPVLWATSDKAFQKAYKEDHDNAPGAGKVFRNLLDPLKDLRHKSIMCHSLGNYVLKWAAAARVADKAVPFSESERFDSIFMVAADTRFDMFDAEREGGSLDGLPLAALARKNVHVLHANNDKALWLSGIRNRRKATGREGAKGPLDPKVKDKIVNKDCARFSTAADSLFCHSYQFHEDALHYYWMYE